MKPLELKLGCKGWMALYRRKRGGDSLNWRQKGYGRLEGEGRVCPPWRRRGSGLGIMKRVWDQVRSSRRERRKNQAGVRGLQGQSADSVEAWRHWRSFRRGRSGGYRHGVFEEKYSRNSPGKKT